MNNLNLIYDVQRSEFSRISFRLSFPVVVCITWFSVFICFLCDMTIGSAHFLVFVTFSVIFNPHTYLFFWLPIKFLG